MRREMNGKEAMGRKGEGEETGPSSGLSDSKGLTLKILEVCHEDSDGCRRSTAAC